MIGDRLRHYKTKTWVEVLKPSLNRYNNQIHSSTKTTPNKAHNLDNVISVRTNLIEGSLEVKLPTIWTDEKQSREEAERRERLEERRVEEKE